MKLEEDKEGGKKKEKKVFQGLKDEQNQGRGERDYKGKDKNMGKEKKRGLKYSRSKKLAPK